MRSVRMMVLAVFAAACGGSDRTAPSTDAQGALLPDTQTVAGVLEMRHPADAFERAPRLTIDSVPLVTIAGGGMEGFDLRYVSQVIPLSDGRYVALQPLGSQRLLLFGTDGAPIRVLASGGGDSLSVAGAMDPVLLPGDTLMILDISAPRVRWFTVDGGFVRTLQRDWDLPAACHDPSGTTTDGRVIAIVTCVNLALSDTARRDPVPVVWFSANSAHLDTVTIVPGVEQAPIERRLRGMPGMSMRAVRLGGYTHAVAWGNDVAIASGVGGYSVERWNTDGQLLGRIVVELPRRAVTEAMRQEVIARDLERMSTRGDSAVLEERRRDIRATRIADSLPPYAGLHGDTDGTLWVSDFAMDGESTRIVTGYRLDGALTGRLEVPGASQPVLFWDGKVMLRERDVGGTVRFVVHAIVRGR